MSLDLGFRMHAERTPNPNSIKWVLGDRLVPLGVSAQFDALVDADISPLAARLFAVQGVCGVLIAGNFVTVTKRDAPEWTDLAEPIVDAIKAHAKSGDGALGEEYTPAELPSEGGEVEQRIRRILEDEVRPIITADGGDLAFVGFEDGIVRVELQGACVGCPSSTATLRFGIEARLREEIPEVTKVVSIQ